MLNVYDDDDDDDYDDDDDVTAPEGGKCTDVARSLCKALLRCEC